MRSFKAYALWFMLPLASVSGYAQVDADQLTFEVASVRPAPPWKPGVVRKCSGGPDTSDSEFFKCSSATITMLVWKAYDVKFYLLKAEDWMQTYNYDVTAKIPRGTTKAQMRTMLRNLLADRFHLVVHHETKPAPSYSLRVNKSGPYFKAAALSPDSPAPFVGDIATKSIGGHWQLVAKKQNMKNLAEYLMSRVWAPVVDDTGLTEVYDFTMDFLPDGAPSGAEGTASDIFEALRSQLGLRLDSKTVPTDFLIIDRADKVPTEN